MGLHSVYGTSLNVFHKVERDFHNILEYKKDKLAENLAKKTFLFDDNLSVDYRKQKVLEKSFDNDKTIEKITKKFFKVNENMYV